MQRINGCPFCRVNRQPWTNHTAEKCSALAAHQCKFCKEYGHTPKCCPALAECECNNCHKKGHTRKNCPTLEQDRLRRWEENQKSIAEEKVKQEEAKANSWAAKVKKSVPAEVKAKIEEEDRKLKEALVAKKAEEAALKKEKKEKWELIRMIKTYGLPEDFHYDPRISNGPIIAKKGDFWYFHTERSNNDTETAKKLREDPENQSRFREYLSEKYFDGWIEASIDSEDDCLYLGNLRWERDIKEEEREEMERKKEEERQIAVKKEKEEMKQKLKNGEITRQEYTEWKWDVEEDMDNMLEFESCRYYESSIRNEGKWNEWRARSKAREELKNKHIV